MPGLEGMTPAEKEQAFRKYLWFNWNLKKFIPNPSDEELEAVGTLYETGFFQKLWGDPPSDWDENVAIPGLRFPDEPN